MEQREPRNKPIYVYIYIKRERVDYYYYFCKDTMNTGERKVFPKQGPKGTEYPCAKKKLDPYFTLCTN